MTPTEQNILKEIKNCKKCNGVTERCIDCLINGAKLQGYQLAQKENQSQQLNDVKEELKKSFDKCDWCECDAVQHNEFGIIDKLAGKKLICKEQ